VLGRLANINGLILGYYKNIWITCCFLAATSLVFGQVKTIEPEQNVDLNEEYYSPNQLLFYPNPATDAFFIEAPDTLLQLKYWLYDAQGGFQLNGSFSPVEKVKHRIPISNLPKGVYLLIIDDGNKRQIRRFAKI
jgi:hypothetical protein